VAASGLDAVSWLVFPAAALPVGLALHGAGFHLPSLVLNALAFVAVILPATLWATTQEAAPKCATLGKRRCGLRVARVATGRAVTRRRALGRNLIKLAIPWELGHTAAFGFAEQPIPGPWIIGLAAATYAVVLINLIGLFTPSRRTVHDRLSGTVVLRADAAE
jgi:uncharacterized RDD family membrane protein YckC